MISLMLNDSVLFQLCLAPELAMAGFAFIAPIEIVPFFYFSHTQK
jgi:hypothetical protein